MSKSRIGYTISAVSKTYDLHPQTLRAYERQGLLCPSRSEGNTRFYTEGDLARLEVILSLTRELGVNLAGVEVILNMRERIERMNREVEELIEFLRMQFDLDADLLRGRFKHALVPTGPTKPIRAEPKSPH